MPYVGRIGDAFVSGHQRYAAVRAADVDWTIDGVDYYAWRLPARPASLPPRMSHHAWIAFGSREDAEEAIGLHNVERSGVVPANKPRDCLVYFPVGVPTFSGSIFLDRDAAAADARIFPSADGTAFGNAFGRDLREFNHPVLQKGDPGHSSLMESWKRTGSLVEASADAGRSISVTAAALVLSGAIDPRDPRIQGLKQASAEHIEGASKSADPMEELRSLRRTLPDERDIQIKAAAAVMVLGSGLKSGNRDQITSSLAVAETLVARSDRPSVAMEGLASAEAGARRF